MITPAQAYLSSLGSDASRRGRITQMNTVAAILIGRRDWQAFDWGTLDAPTVDTVMSKATGSPATRNALLATLKAVARAAFRLGSLSADGLATIRETKAPRGSRIAKGRDVRADELAALLAACEDQSALGARDAAMIALAAATGSRRAEVASLAIQTMTELDGGILAFRVIGKGDKERAVYVTGKAAETVKAWLGIRGTEAGPLFCRLRRGGNLDQASSGLSMAAMDKALSKRMQAAGVKGITWHDFRRTIAGDLLDKGADIVTVAGILG
ncbi:MAG: tyrosine-type recombinase/integrase, partial [Verrucomicrobiales bacterium]